MAIPSLLSSIPNSSSEQIIPSLETPLISLFLIVKFIALKCVPTVAT